MTLIWTCLIGLIVGAVARFLMPGRDPGGILVTILLGIAGSIVGRYLGKVLGIYAAGETAGLVMSVVGAMLLLLVYRKVAK